MAKHIACGDVVDGCSFTAEVATESELVEQVKVHVAKVYGVEEITPKLAAKMKKTIQTR
jgi:predicted small metal-binding protein